MNKDFWKNQIEKKGKLCFLAPMDGYGDSAYRQTMKKVAPHIECITEFYSADGLVHSKLLAESVLKHSEIEKPLIVQIFGKDPINFALSAKIIEKYNIAGIDVNMGCPAKKVVKSGHGAGLLINECRAYEIIDELSRATKLPISVKTRLGFDGTDNLIKFAKGLEKAGANMITVHGRTAKQAYTGKADFDGIYELKKHIGIPVICNGDVINFTDGIKKIQNLDGFMIGRATFGNPWCFIKNFELIDHNGNSRPGKFIDGMYNPTLGEILEIAEYHAVKLVETKQEKKGCLEIRKHLVCYLKNFPGVKNYRKKLVSVENLDEVLLVLNDIRKEFNSFLNTITIEIPKETIN